MRVKKDFSFLFKRPDFRSVALRYVKPGAPIVKASFDNFPLKLTQSKKQGRRQEQAGYTRHCNMVQLTLAGQRRHHVKITKGARPPRASSIRHGEH
jgi:hypothetical protein